jgi:hypothetical protein
MSTVSMEATLLKVDFGESNLVAKDCQQVLILLFML